MEAREVTNAQVVRRVAPAGVLVVALVVGVSVFGGEDPGGGDGGGGNTGDGYMGTYGGNPSVYQRIASDTDCDSLQAQFDQAAANHDRDSEAGDLEAMKWSTGYMSAADDRMRAIGCY